jgi:hypothetical protein
LSYKFKHNMEFFFLRKTLFYNDKACAKVQEKLVINYLIFPWYRAKMELP